MSISDMIKILSVFRLSLILDKQTLNNIRIYSYKTTKYAPRTNFLTYGITRTNDAVFIVLAGLLYKIWPPK